VGAEFLALQRNADTEAVLRKAKALFPGGRPVVVDVAIDYSSKTWFTRGVVRTNLERLPWPDRLRMITRALARRVR
jgi:acetolactate synthase-1/2/3 large subunit